MSEEKTAGAPVYRLSYGLMGITAHDFVLTVINSLPKADAGLTSYEEDAVASVAATITMNPVAAKFLLRNLQITVEGYESAFGEIKLHPVGAPEDK